MKNSDTVIAVKFKGNRGSFKLDVEFECPMQGITGLFGPSGCGKTTILRCIAGLDRFPGRLVIGGEVWEDETSAFYDPHRRSIGYVFQEASLFAHLSVQQNLLYGHQRAIKMGVTERIRFDTVVALMSIGHLLNRATNTLSGGERQRVAIGRALLSQPRLLLMDEPLSALDELNKDRMLPFLEALHDTLSIPILYVTHDLSELERLADNLVLLEEGRVIASGALPELLTDGRLSISKRADAATVVEADHKSYDPQYSLTEMDVHGEMLLIPGRIGEENKRYRVRIAAADVSLSPNHPSQTSILNVLRTRVAEIHPVGEAQVNIVMTIGHGDSGPRLLARISRRAYETLKFSEGQKIYAQVKAVSLVGAGPTGPKNPGSVSEK